MSQPGKREAMETAARNLAKPDAAKEIVEGCLGLIENHAKTQEP